MNEVIPTTTPVTPIEKTEREMFVDSLRDCAAFFEAHPDIPLPSTKAHYYLFPLREQMVKYARIFGKCRKSGDENFFNLTKDFGLAVDLEAAWYRNQVCERVVVGKKKVEVPKECLEPLAPAELLQEEPAQISDVQF